jgi:hypothetical protein
MGAFSRLHRRARGRGLPRVRMSKDEPLIAAAARPRRRLLPASMPTSARGEREAQMKPPRRPRGLGAMVLGVYHAMRFSRVPRPKMERRSGLSLLRVDSITSSAQARSVVGMWRPNCHSSIRDHAGTCRSRLKLRPPNQAIHSILDGRSQTATFKNQRERGRRILSGSAHKH